MQPMHEHWSMSFDFNTICDRTILFETFRAFCTLITFRSIRVTRHEYRMYHQYGLDHSLD